MEKVLRIILPLLALVLAYLIYQTIARPVKEQQRIERREDETKKRLLQIKAAQFAFKNRHSVFAEDFNVLLNALKTDKVPVVRQDSVRSDSGIRVIYDTSWIPMFRVAFPEGNVYIDSLPYVPESGGTRFVLNAGLIEKNMTMVPVFEVYDPKPYKDGMSLRLGSMTEAVFSGNWE